MIKALLGPNGAGKSTYLRHLMGIESGKVDLTMAMVFQEPLLFDLTVFENVALGLHFRKVKSMEQKVNFWLDKLQIGHLKNRNALKLSSGEAQKVALARALAIEPRTLLLDEPTANLDLPSQIKLRAELKKLIAENNLDAVWVTHNKAEALEVADYLMIMINYQIVQEGKPEEVVQKPANQNIAAFLGIENIFHGRIVGSFFENSQIRFEVAVEDKDSAWVIVHPEDIILSAAPIQGTSARNCLVGTIEEAAAAGLTYRIKINAGEVFYVTITRISAEELGICSGRKVFLTFKATAVKTVK